MSDDGLAAFADSWRELGAALRAELDHLLGPLVDWLSRHLPKPR